MPPAMFPVMPQVTLYTKPDCALCTQLYEDLRWVQQERAFALTTLDICTDPALFERFQYFVPILEIDGTLYFPPHDLLQLRQRILSAASP